MSTPKGTLVWSSAPTASQPTQPTTSPTPPSGSLQWTNSPTYSSADIFTIPVDNKTTADRLRETMGYTPNITRQKDINTRFKAGQIGIPEATTQTAMNTVGAFLAPVAKGISKVIQGADYVLSGKGAYNPIPEKWAETNLYTKLKTELPKAYEKTVSNISDNPATQAWSNTETGFGNAKSFEEYLRGANDLLAIMPLPKAVSAINKVMSPAEEYALQQLNKVKSSVEDASLKKVVNQIKQTEKVGAGAKTAYSPQDELVLLKMAESNVLPSVVDKTGTVDATKIKAAQQQYLELPIGTQEDGTTITVRNAESVVGRLLKQEGTKVNINEVTKALEDAVRNTNLPADVMQRAIDRAVPQFAQALMKYADEFGNILLDKIHQEKIRTTTGLDYSKPLNKIYRKALASGLRQIIENKSTHPIKAINKELAIHLEVVKRIGNLAGKKVEGGRIGTHVARGVGTGLGIVLGKVAGPIGATVGGAVGGEVGAAVQSAKMQGTFGRAGESRMQGSKLLEEASVQAEKPPTRNLRVADKAVGAPKGIPKTKEVLRLEKAIKENVQAQKEAIRAKDFELVAKLKEVYDILVNKLKETIRKIKNIPNRQGGFANFGESLGKSPKPSEGRKSTRISSANDTTNPLNYKTAEEFVKAQGEPVYHATPAPIDSFKTSKQRFGKSGYGFYFSDLRGAEKYNKYHKEFMLDTLYDGTKKNPQIIEAYVNMKNPLKIEHIDDLPSWAIDKNQKFGVARGIFGNLSPEGKTALERAGYDGVITTETMAKKILKRDGLKHLPKGHPNADTAPMYMVLREDQIKTRSQLTDIWKQAHNDPFPEIKTKSQLIDFAEKESSFIPTKKINRGEDVMIAAKDVREGRKSMSSLPILVEKMPDGTYDVLDGKHRFVQDVTSGKTEVLAMTDEKLYRELTKKEEMFQTVVSAHDRSGTAGVKSYVRDKKVVPPDSSEPSGLSQEEIKIQESISKQDFEKVVERFFPQVKEFYSDDGITNFREYLNKIDPKTIAMELDSYPEPKKAIVDLLGGDWEIQVDDVISAYKSGAMKDSISRKPFELNLEKPQDVPVKGNQPFYAPQKRSADIKKTFDTASQKVVSANKESVLSARKDLVFEWATNSNLPEQLGMKASELNKKIRSISGLPAESSKTQIKVNAGIPEQHHWTGITNSNFLKKNGVELKHIDRIVNNIDDKTAKLGSYQGDSLRHYIMNTFLSIDTRLKYNDLNFKVGQLERALGEYSNKDLTITIKTQSQNTVAHEIGHYLDYRFARELGIDNSLSAGGYNWEYVQQRGKISPEHIAWAKEYVRFTDSLVKKSEIGYSADRATYLQKPTEVFARFTAKFVDWTAKKSGYHHSELNYYSDSFTESDYYTFIKLLQKKSEIDSKYNIVPTVENPSGSVNANNGRSPI